MAKRWTVWLCSAVWLVACRRAPPMAHIVTVVDSGPMLMVSGMFGAPGAVLPLAPLGPAAGLRAGRCLRLPSARQLYRDPRVASASQAPGVRYRNAGELTVRDDRGPELAALRPAMHGLYLGVIPRGDVRRLRVQVQGGDGVPAHVFDSIPLNPPGNPTRITSPPQGFVLPRGAPLRVTWAGTGYRDAFLNVALGDLGAADAGGLVCRLEFGRGAVTIPGSDLELRGNSGPLSLSLSLVTMTSSVEGPWVLNATSAAVSVSGLRR